jgi:PTS system beta-glucosides-specific IIC component
VKIFGTKNTQEKPDRNLYGCCEGLVIDLKDSDDDIVSSGILGEGYAVYPCYEHIKSPTGGYIVEISSPVKGRVVDITHKPEVIILKNEEGLKVLVSFVSFSGSQVCATVRCGDDVAAGDHIADLKLSENNDKAFFVIVENSESLEKFEIFKGKTASNKPAAEYKL